MNIKTFVPVILLISIMFSGCAAEVEYWIKRMEEAEKKSAEKTADTKAVETQAEVSEQSVSTPPAPVTPVAPPVTWPSTGKVSNIQEPELTTGISSLVVTTEQPQKDVTAMATFTINIKGGEKYIGEILLDEIPFKSTYGVLNVKPGDMASFVDGNIRMKDGTSIKGVINQETLKIKTGLLGELEIKTSEIESITR
jgi:hypothetical protein